MSSSVSASGRFVRVSSYRHVVGKPNRVEFTDLRLAAGGDGPNLAINEQFFAFPTVGGGGPVTVWPLSSKTTRLPLKTPILTLHREAVLDLQFSPFVPTVLSAASDDCHVTVTNIPTDGLSDNITTPFLDLIGHERRVNYLHYHPTANNILSSASADNTIKLWDISGSSNSTDATHTIPFADTPFSLSYSPDGSLMVVNTKDLNIHIIDPRHGDSSNSHSGSLHTVGFSGPKKSHSLWRNSQQIIAVGQSKQQNFRQFGLWDLRNFSTPVTLFDFDRSPGHLMPHYDTDNNILYVAGKGDSSISYFEVVDNAPCFHYLSEYRDNSSQKGVAFLPKRLVDTKTCEISICGRLLKDKLQLISFQVPRKAAESFQKDLYPDAYAGIPTIEGKEYLEGKNGEMIKVSMNPKEKKGGMGLVVSGGAEKAAASSSSSSSTLNIPASSRATSASVGGQTTSTAPVTSSSTSTPSSSSSTSASSSTPLTISVTSNSPDDDEKEKERKRIDQAKSSALNEIQRRRALTVDPPSSSTSSSSFASSSVTSPKSSTSASSSPSPPNDYKMQSMSVSGRFVRSSLYRHIVGTIKPNAEFADIVPTFVGDGNYMAANEKFFVYSTVGGGGPIIVWSMNRPGRLPKGNKALPFIATHKDIVSEYDFNPFNPYLLATGSEDNHIHLNCIPEGGLVENITTPLLDMSSHSRKVNWLRWNPIVNNLLLSSSHDNTIQLFDINTNPSESFLSIPLPDIPQSVEWNPNGSHVALTCKDGNIHVVDPRQSSAENGSVRCQGLNSNKVSRVVWRGDNQLIVVGNSKQSSQLRQYALFDIRSGFTNSTTPSASNKALIYGDIDSSPGLLIPHYDNDNNILYCSGRGDSTIKCWEVVDDSPYFHYLSEYRDNSSQKGVVVLPKRNVSTQNTEIATFARLLKDKMQLISFSIPRKASESFQKDLYPDCYAGVPTMEAEEWRAGKNGIPLKMNLNPKGLGGGGNKSATVNLSMLNAMRKDAGMAVGSGTVVTPRNVDRKIPVDLFAPPSSTDDDHDNDAAEAKRKEKERVREEEIEKLKREKVRLETEKKVIEERRAADKLQADKDRVTKENEKAKEKAEAEASKKKAAEAQAAQQLMSDIENEQRRKKEMEQDARDKVSSESHALALEAEIHRKDEETKKKKKEMEMETQRERVKMEKEKREMKENEERQREREEANRKKEESAEKEKAKKATLALSVNIANGDSNTHEKDANNDEAEDDHSSSLSNGHNGNGNASSLLSPDSSSTPSSFNFSPSLSSSSPSPFPTFYRAAFTQCDKKNWIPDSSRSACKSCEKSFSMTKLRHHCRCCSDIFCDDCTKWRLNARKFSDSNKIIKTRVCDTCYDMLYSVLEGEMDRARRKIEDLKEAMLKQKEIIEVYRDTVEMEKQLQRNIVGEREE